MILPDVAAVLSIAEFAGRIISRFKKKKKKLKTKPRKTKPRLPKPTKEEAMIEKLMKNPEEAIKEIGSEYIVKNRKRLIRKIENYVDDQI